MELITGTILAGSALLLGNSGSLIRLHQKLSDHIDAEEEDRRTLQGIRSRLRRVERKLPNGEIQLIFEMLKDMYKDQNGSYGLLAPKIAQVENEVRMEKVRQEKETLDDVFGEETDGV